MRWVTRWWDIFFDDVPFFWVVMVIVMMAGWWMRITMRWYAYRRCLPWYTGVWVTMRRGTYRR